MSRPPPPPPIHPPSTATFPPPIMTETQNLPSLPPPPFLGHPYRRLPQPVQLPPLSIPPNSSIRPDLPYISPATQTLPSLHPAPPLRSQPRLHHGVAPVEKLLSSNPYTPPRSDPPYSPQHGSAVSPRSEYEARPPRRLVERYPTEDTRPYPAEPPSYASPVEPPRRASGAPLPSPSYTPGYASGTTPFRGAPGSHYTPGSSSLAPPMPYGEPVTAPPRAAPSSLPAPSQPPQMPEPPQLHYELRVRQQPIAARACGFGERDRRVIDPPPIIQLLVTDPQTGVPDTDELRYSLNVVHCTLWNADGTNEETALIQPDRRTTRRLMGQLVASPSIAKDEHDIEGCFFCFPDLSCRTHGRYRLRFILMRIDPMNLHVGGYSPILTEVLSDVFTVYTAKDFPGMRPSSALTRALKLQGCNIQVKKGNEKALARRRARVSDDDDDDAGGDSGKRRRKE